MGSKQDRELDQRLAREELFRSLYRQIKPGLVCAYAKRYQASEEVASRAMFMAVLEPVLVDFHTAVVVTAADIDRRLPDVQEHYRVVLDRCAAAFPDAAYNTYHAERFTFVMAEAARLLHKPTELLV